jgi:hypothetical protein
MVTDSGGGWFLHKLVLTYRLQCSSALFVVAATTTHAVPFQYCISPAAVPAACPFILAVALPSPLTSVKTTSNLWAI